MSMSMRVRLVAMAAAALLLAVGENRLLWGYWISRPSLASELDGIDRLLAVSVLASDLNTGRVSRKQRPDGLTAAQQPCRPRTNECLEGSLLLQLAPQRLTEKTPEVADDLVQQAWAQLKTDSPIRVGSPQYQRTGKPIAGLAIQFVKGDQESLLLAQRTSEISDDRFAYVESLYRANGGSLVPVRQVRYFFEVAGLEGIEWPILWPVNFVVLLLAFLPIAWLARKREARTAAA